MKQYDRYSYWGTEREINFLKGIGGWSDPPKSRQKCLIGYLRGARQRKDWMGIDKQRVIDFAEYLLEIEVGYK